jgi:hypothetical protein
MDEVSSHVCLNLPFKLTARPRERLFYLVLESHDGRAPGADSEEKREPVSDIDIAVADSLRVLDLKRPIREADIAGGLSRTKSGLSRPLHHAVAFILCASFVSRSGNSTMPS